MGNTSSSTVSATAPFAISDSTNNDLNRLSFIATRLLSSSDLYDVENLAKPGTCGNYSVVLQKGIENTLLPFVVDLDNNQLSEVFYHDPRKAFADLEKRKKVCKDLTKTMLRAIATVTAALASIQVVKSRSRDAIVMAAEKQKGGDIQAVGKWLRDAGFISEYRTAGTPMEFITPGGMHLSRNVKFMLTLEYSTGSMSYGLFQAIGNDYPNGTLRIFFLYQILLPGTQTYVMPIRIVDKPGRTWVAGILVEGRFKSFVEKTPPEYMTAILERLFLTASGTQVQGGYPETRSELALADDIFNKLQKSQSPIPMLQTLNRYFSEMGIGYQPVVSQMGYPQPGYPQPVYPQPGYPQPGYPQPVYPQPTYPQPAYPPAYPRPGYPQAGYPSQYQPGSVALRTQGDTGQYDLPINVVRYILDRLKYFQKGVATQSCPAEERAATLMGAGFDDSRNIRTAICNDPYWKKSNLNDVHPWATFQFLAIDEWDNAGDRSKPTLNPEWTNFLQGLKNIYEDKFNNQSPFLDQARFSSMDKLPVCATGGVGNQAKVFAGINELQTLYKTHVTKIWSLINSLIVVIQHPESKKDIIRFHPNVLRSGKSSRKYVDQVAKDTMAALREHYLAIETAYYRVAKDDNLKKR